MISSNHVLFAIVLKHVVSNMIQLLPRKSYIKKFLKLCHNLVCTQQLATLQLSYSLATELITNQGEGTYSYVLCSFATSYIYVAKLCAYNNTIFIQYHNLQLVFIFLHLQEIKRDNEGVRSCKITLYRTFLKCGIKTWEKVINALENSGHDDVAKHVKMQLLKNYSKVMNIMSSSINIMLFSFCDLNFLVYKCSYMTSYIYDVHDKSGQLRTYLCNVLLILL